MKKWLIISALTLNLVPLIAQVSSCDSALLSEMINYKMTDGAGFMTDYCVALDSSVSDSLPEKTIHIVLLANIRYRFIIKSSSKYKGEAKLVLEKTPGVQIASTGFQKGKKPEKFDIRIPETRSYNIRVSFKDGKSGSAAAAIFYVPDKEIKIKD